VLAGGVAVLIGLWLAGPRPAGPGPLRVIPQRLLYPDEAARSAWALATGRGDPFAPALGRFTRNLPVEAAAPVAHVPVPRHPFMAAGGNNMHDDAYLSDTYAASGPLGVAPEVFSRSQGFGGYGTLAFDRAGRIVAVYSNGRGFQLELMDPHTLEELAWYDLPSRPWYFPLQGVLPWEYIGAGMYFYLDDRDRAVVPTARNRVEVIQTPPPGSGAGFERVAVHDLSGFVAPLPWPAQDSVAWVLPDWQGGFYWFATTAGVIGTVSWDSTRVSTLRLEGEIIENSFAVGEEGVFIVSDHALYRFGRDAVGAVRPVWRTPYDRGPGPKPGHITRGSGCSVTLVGGSDGVVVITDNAEPRLHVQLFRRTDGTELCRVPVFPEGRSGTDLSVAAFEHAGPDGKGLGHYSVLVENNWGHHRFPRSRPEPGLSRVDARPAGGGRYECEESWSSAEKSLGVFKLSLGNGLVYMYGRDDSPTATGWYFIAVDFRSGETVYRRHAGNSVGFNNWAGALFLHPDAGIAYTTTLFGLAALRDGAGPAASARTRSGRQTAR
jgi:hypothetical protein